MPQLEVQDWLAKMGLASKAGLVLNPLKARSYLDADLKMAGAKKSLICVCLEEIFHWMTSQKQYML